MVKKISALILAAMLLLSASALADGDLLAEVQNRGELIIGTEGMWAPWTFHNENDELVGFDVEVAQAVAEKLGVKATFAEVEWDAIFAGIGTKRFDTAANGVEIIEERTRTYDFSVPYAYSHTALVVRGDNEDIKTFEDLDGKTTTNSIASTYMLLAESYGAYAVGVDTIDQTIDNVVAGRADATLNADVSVLEYLTKHPDANIKIVAVTEEASPIAMPIRKGEENATLLAAIDQAITELREEGKLTEISMKYFGVDITAVPETEAEEGEPADGETADAAEAGEATDTTEAK